MDSFHVTSVQVTHSFSFSIRSNTILSTATVVAVNDPFLTPEYAAYQFKYDSVHGIYPAEVTHEEGFLIVGDVRIKFFSERNPAGTCFI